MPVAAFPASRRPRAFSWQESMRVQGEAKIWQPKVKMIEIYAFSNIKEMLPIQEIK